MKTATTKQESYSARYLVSFTKTKAMSEARNSERMTHEYVVCGKRDIELLQQSEIEYKREVAEYDAAVAAKVKKWNLPECPDEFSPMDGVTLIGLIEGDSNVVKMLQQVSNGLEICTNYVVTNKTSYLSQWI